jgi:colanic acid/amylovoran biosynthesis protein
MMRIAIIDQPYCNRGDESAHKAFIRQLVKAFPDCSIDVFFRSPNNDANGEMNVNLQSVSYYNLNLGRFCNRIIRYTYFTHTTFLSYFYKPLRNFKKLIKNYDYIIGAPGGMNMGGFVDWLHLWFFETARRMGKPVLYWGRSIGPFYENNYQSKLFKKQSTKLLKYFAFTALRDSISVKCADELGVKVEEIVDSAFLELPDAKVPENILKEIGNTDYIVFVPNELTWHTRYKKVDPEKIDNFFLAVLELCLKHWPERKIVMLPQTYKSIINDYSYFKKLARKYGSKNIVVIDEDQNSDIQQKIISQSKLVIGARYHSIIFSINNNIPFISLSYEHKMKGLLEKLGMREYMVEIDDIFDKGHEDKFKYAIEKIEKIMLLEAKNIDRTIAMKIVSTGFEKMTNTLHSFK